MATTLETAQTDLCGQLKTAIRRTELKNLAEELDRLVRQQLKKLGDDDKVYFLEQLQGISNWWGCEYQLLMDGIADETVDLQQPF